MLVRVTVGDWAMVTLHRPSSVTSAPRKRFGKDVYLTFHFNMQYYMSYLDHQMYQFELFAFVFDDIQEQSDIFLMIHQCNDWRR